MKDIKIHMCRKDDMHPYECAPLSMDDKPCIHCERKKFDGHDPETCVLCNEINLF